MEYSLEQLQLAYQSSLKGGNLLKFSDLKIGMEVVTLIKNFDSLIGKLTIHEIDKDDCSIRVKDENGRDRWFWYPNYGFNWKVAEYELLASDNESEVTLLTPSDYENLIDIALMTNDKAWFNELCGMVKVGEQHA